MFTLLCHLSSFALLHLWSVIRVMWNKNMVFCECICVMWSWSMSYVYLFCESIFVLWYWDENGVLSLGSWAHVQPRTTRPDPLCAVPATCAAVDGHGTAWWAHRAVPAWRLSGHAINGPGPARARPSIWPSILATLVQNHCWKGCLHARSLKFLDNQASNANIYLTIYPICNMFSS